MVNKQDIIGGHDHHRVPENILSLTSCRSLALIFDLPPSHLGLPGEELRNGRTWFLRATRTHTNSSHHNHYVVCGFELFISEFNKVSTTTPAVMSTSTIANAVVSKQECQHTGSGIPSEHRVFECSMIPTVNVFAISVPQAYQLGVRILASDIGIPAF
ncbi:hypothetical protein PQX77_006442 [Marasmius sp. AFHP31]|nr:hypothetical protein PQX77_006442 [Marasmius sp. AFHP31]